MKFISDMYHRREPKPRTLSYAGYSLVIGISGGWLAFRSSKEFYKWLHPDPKIRSTINTKKANQIHAQINKGRN